MTLINRIHFFILINLIVPKLEHAETCEGNENFGKQLGTVQMTTKNVLLIGYSSTTSDTALITEREMHPLGTNKKVEMTI